MIQFFDVCTCTGDDVDTPPPSPPMPTPPSTVDTQTTEPGVAATVPAPANISNQVDSRAPANEDVALPPAPTSDPTNGTRIDGQVTGAESTE